MPPRNPRRPDPDEPPRRLELGELTPFTGPLGPNDEYESLLVADGRWAVTDGDHATFIGCHFLRCDLGEASFRRTRLNNCLIEESGATTADFGDTGWRDVVVSGGRFGALRAPASTWTDVRVRSAKLDFVDLTATRLESVAFEGCVIGALDLGDTRATGLTFGGCRIDEINLDGARLERADLTGAQLGIVRGVRGLRGGRVTLGQLMDLAPLLAADIGIEVRDT
jgi:uncharacterized protein YjbI with pentapeptide repeats